MRVRGVGIEMKQVIKYAVVLLAFAVVCPATAQTPIPMMGANNKIDELVYAKLKEKGIPPSELCTDEIFIRRVYLDVIGTLPKASEAREFLDSKDLSKRKKLIDRLLERPEYADYWSLKWCDLLKVKAEFPSNLWPNAVQAYHRWVRDALNMNMPYDQFARELLLASGSNFRSPPVNFYRAIPSRDPASMAQVTALLFMGMRPTTLTDQQKLGMSAFFEHVGYKKTAEWKEEVVFSDPTKSLRDPKTNRVIPLRLPNGTIVKRQPGRDSRELFVEWLVSPKNEYFNKNIVNRIWSWLLGRGLIHEADDIRPDNPPSNPELLAYLEQELVEKNYDLRQMYRLILNSRTYQLSSVHNVGNIKDDIYNSHYQVHRLYAEVLIDAICQITNSKESYSSAIPEPFTFIPESQRSITLADGSITSPFLEKFGRPPRATGYEAERNNEPSSSQMLHLLNSSHIYDKIARSPLVGGGGGNYAIKKKKSAYSSKKGRSRIQPKAKSKRSESSSLGGSDAFTEKIYLTVLSRYPTDREKEIAIDYMSNSGVDRREAAVDLVWALINSKEFLFRH